MKIRRGFVSNSSSSSFIVEFPHKPESVIELQKMLFGDAKVYVGPYDNKQWNVRTIAEIVWRDIEQPTTLAEISDTFASGYTTDQPDRDDFRDEKDKIDWDAYNEAMKEFSDKRAKSLVDAHPNTVSFSFEYSDNDGDMYSAMEHGTLFDNLPHLRISHH